MKTKAVSTLLLCLCSLLLFAQKKKIPVPETLSEINYYNKKANTAEKLEKGNARMVTKAKGLGFGGAATNYEMTGDTSTVRLAASDSLSFIVTLADGMGDPTGWFSLFKTTTKKGKRIGNYINSKVLIGTGSSSGTGIVAYSVKKLETNVYEIIPDTKLDKGEYFFVNKGTMSNYGGVAADAFAFAIN